MTLNNQWTRVFIDQSVVSLAAVALVALFAGPQQAASTAAGAAIMTLNMALLGWTWTRIMTKKSVALASAIIVIKYAFFVAILVWIAAQSWVQGIWLMAGVVTFLPTTLIFAWRGSDGPHADTGEET